MSTSKITLVQSVVHESTVSMKEDHRIWPKYKTVSIFSFGGTNNNINLNCLDIGNNINCFCYKMQYFNRMIPIMEILKLLSFLVIWM
jgi:hypothetical protein